MARFITTTKGTESFGVPINIDLVCAIEKSKETNTRFHVIYFHFTGTANFSWIYDKLEDRDSEFDLIIKEFGYTLTNEKLNK